MMSRRSSSIDPVPPAPGTIPIRHAPRREWARAVLVELQWIAALVGWMWVLAGAGCFLVGVLDIAAVIYDWGRPFKFAGILLTPGWLLLRFASGLFPFGRRMFR